MTNRAHLNPMDLFDDLPRWSGVGRRGWRTTAWHRWLRGNMRCWGGGASTWHFGGCGLAV